MHTKQTVSRPLRLICTGNSLHSDNVIMKKYALYLIVDRHFVQKEQGLLMEYNTLSQKCYWDAPKIATTPKRGDLNEEFFRYAQCKRLHINRAHSAT